MFLPSAATARKPEAPVKIKCATLSEAGDVYTASCEITLTDVAVAPESIALLPFKAEGVELTNSSAPADESGIGEWTLTFRFTDNSPAKLRFEVRYPNNAVMRIRSVYDPFKNMRPASALKKIRAVTVKDDKGRNIQEFPSK